MPTECSYCKVKPPVLPYERDFLLREEQKEVQRLRHSTQVTCTLRVAGIRLSTDVEGVEGAHKDGNGCAAFVQQLNVITVTVTVTVT